MTSSKKTAFISGVPLGAAIFFVESLRASGSYVEYANWLTPAIVVYFVVVTIFLVIGLPSIKSRASSSISEFIENPIGFIRFHSTLVARDLLQMLLFFGGGIVGGLLWSLSQRI